MAPATGDHIVTSPTNEQVIAIATAFNVNGRATAAHNNVVTSASFGNGYVHLGHVNRHA